MCNSRMTVTGRSATTNQSCCSRRKSSSSRILENQFTSPCPRPHPRTPSPCSCPCPREVSPGQQLHCCIYAEERRRSETHTNDFYVVSRLSRRVRFGLQRFDICRCRTQGQWNLLLRALVTAVAACRLHHVSIANSSSSKVEPQHTGHASFLRLIFHKVV